MGLRDEIIGDSRNGRFARILTRYCAGWRSTHSPYAIDHAIAHLVEANDANAVFDMLIDLDFRSVCIARGGVNGFQRDLARGRELFSSPDHPDLLRYLQLLFVRATPETDESSPVRTHRLHAKAFEQFLQLNAPPSAAPAGLRRVISDFFPMEWKGDLKRRERVDLAEQLVSKGITTVNLAAIEVGTWRCPCGALEGHARRFDYACSCGAVAGQGLLGPDPRRCADCGVEPVWLRCPSCDSRVTLDSIERLKHGGVHPSEMELPVFLDLSVHRPSGAVESTRLLLMRVPVMLALRERAGEILFDLPDAFWLETNGGRSSARDGTAMVLAMIADSVHDDRQTELGDVLEALLRDTLTEREAGRSLRARIRQRVADGNGGSIDDGVTRGFVRRLRSPENRVTRQTMTSDDAMGLADVSRECGVAGTSALRDGMAFINRSLLEPGGLHLSFVGNYVTSLRRSAHGDDILIPVPSPESDERDSRWKSLERDGIVRVGEMVLPWQILLRRASPQAPDAQTIEEKMWEAMLSQMRPGFKDTSLAFDSDHPCRVIAVHIVTAKRWKRRVLDRPGRFIEKEGRIQLEPDELARITISAAMAQRADVGDALGDGESQAVICRILGESSLASLAGTRVAPDVLVSADHPWVRGHDTSESPRPMHLRVQGDGLLRQKVVRRGFGPVSLTESLPMAWEGNESPAQTVDADDFDWLLSRQAIRTVFELAGPRCDCTTWKQALFKASLKGRCRVDALLQQAPAAPHDLRDAPGDRMRNLALHLFALGIAVTLNETPSSSTLEFRLVDDDEKRRASHGEVTEDDALVPRIGPGKGGLFCQRIFGPLRDFVCACGETRGVVNRGRVCEKCGVAIVKADVRRTRMGHIVLATPIAHPLFERDLADHADTRGLGRPAPMRVLNVLPPDRRPIVPVGTRFATSDLNTLYRKVLQSNRRLLKFVELRAPAPIVHQERSLLHRAVARLFDNARVDNPLRSSFQHQLVSIADHCRRVARKGTFLSGILRRPLDYSAKTRLAVVDTGELDTGEFPETLLLKILLPRVLHRLQQMGMSSPGAAYDEVQRRSDRAKEALGDVCTNAVVLIGCGLSPYRLVALHPKPGAAAAVLVNPRVLELIGWENLGRDVKMLAVLSEEAQEECLRTLLPSKLPPVSAASSSVDAWRRQREASSFHIEEHLVMETFAMRALQRESHVLGPYDRLALSLPID